MGRIMGKASIAVKSFMTIAMVSLCSIVVLAEGRTNPNQQQIDELADKKTLAEAKTEALKADAELIKAQSPLLGTDFGKKGDIAITGTDTVRVVSRVTAGLQQTANQIGEFLRNEKDPVVLLTDLDRTAIARYWNEKETISRLKRKSSDLLHDNETASSAEATQIYALGLLLSQVAQFSQLLRTDKSIAIVSSNLSEDLLLDLIAAQTPQKTLYPSAGIDALLSGSSPSQFAKDVAALPSLRERLVKLSEPAKKDTAKGLVTQIDEFLQRLAAADTELKSTNLLLALRGELASGYIDAAQGRIFSVKILAQGGLTMTSKSMWRGDKYYVSGNTVVSYRLTSAKGVSTVLMADIITTDVPFKEIPTE